ncbi:MAG: transglutaminase domain protein [Candidatus Solibacter sp.]|jgi:transglutaminase-like putative cysteine protease|nr:transglutaminase domain protein [Candidatus Solibacter sp.]
MRISIVHSTVYRYDSPVFLEPHTFRLRPREDGTQRLSAYLISISPTPAGQTQCLDHDGNVIIQAWFSGSTPQLSVQTSFVVETHRENPFDFLLAPPDRVLPMEYAELLRAPLCAYQLAPPNPAVRELAESIAAESGWQTIPFLSALNLRLNAITHQVIRHEGAPLPAEETLRTGEGSCRDLAVLFCAACRAVGLAARFVSGYERDSADVDEGDLHAWAEVYLQGGGWRGYDPSRGLAVGLSHVAVAAAAAPLLAAPITGTYRGAANARMEFSIAMQVG